MKITSKYFISLSAANYFAIIAWVVFQNAFPQIKIIKYYVLFTVLPKLGIKWKHNKLFYK